MLSRRGRSLWRRRLGTGTRSCYQRWRGRRVWMRTMRRRMGARSPQNLDNRVKLQMGTARRRTNLPQARLGTTGPSTSRLARGRQTSLGSGRRLPSWVRTRRTEPRMECSGATPNSLSLELQMGMGSSTRMRRRGTMLLHLHLNRSRNRYTLHKHNHQWSKATLANQPPQDRSHPTAQTCRMLRATAVLKDRGKCKDKCQWRRFPVRRRRRLRQPCPSSRTRISKAEGAVSA
jgi:hypothetical protein